MNSPAEVSSYLKWLPAIFQGSSEVVAREPVFLGRFLKAFEKILTGLGDELEIEGQTVVGFSELLDRIDTLFDPLETRVEMLDWLAGWIGLTLGEKAEWDEARRRRLFTEVIPLYAWRGTPNGLAAYLRAYLGGVAGVEVSVSEFLQPMQVGAALAVGEDTVVGEGRPYYFQAYLRIGSADWQGLERQIQTIIALVNQEKPAYAYYLLIVKVPKLQIGIHSTVGADMLIGGAEIVAQPNGRWSCQN